MDDLIAAAKLAASRSNDDRRITIYAEPTGIMTRGVSYGRHTRYEWHHVLEWSQILARPSILSVAVELVHRQLEEAEQREAT